MKVSIFGIGLFVEFGVLLSEQSIDIQQTLEVVVGLADTKLSCHKDRGCISVYAEV